MNSLNLGGILDCLLNKRRKLIISGWEVRECHNPANLDWNPESDQAEAVQQHTLAAEMLTCQG